MSQLITKRIKIINAKGLHARASAKFVKTAEKYECEIIVQKDGIDVGGTSIMGLLLLAANQGSHIEISAKGKDAPEALADIEALILDKFGEEI